MEGGGGSPKVLIYDIESSPIISYNWGIYEQNAIEVIEDWQILCFAYKWLGEKKVYVVSQDDFKGYKPGVNNDLNVVRALHALFDEADVVIAHNAVAFDNKKSHARMITHGMKPPSPYKTIDTLKIARKYAGFTSNKLDDIGQKLGQGKKLETGGFKIWKGCLLGDSRSWSIMKKYNKQDVILLEKVYLKLRPWIDNHPGMNLQESCPKCGKGPLQRRGTPKSVKTGTYQRYQCQSCGGWCTDRNLIKSGVKYVN